MNKIFLGKPIHWLMIIIATAIIFACGINKMHVSDFNLFITKSKDFINYQSNAGRSWGGDTIDYFTNIKNNLYAYNLTKILIPISLILSLFLLLGLFYKSLNYFRRGKIEHFLFLGLNILSEL